MNDNNVQLFKQKLGEVCVYLMMQISRLWKSFKSYLMNVSQKSVLRNDKVETTQGRLGYLSLY